MAPNPEVLLENPLLDREQPGEAKSLRVANWNTTNGTFLHAVTQAGRHRLVHRSGRSLDEGNITTQYSYLENSIGRKLRLPPAGSKSWTQHLQQ